MREPYLRKSTGSWYVWHNGKQHNLGKDKDEAFRKWHLLAGMKFTVPSDITIGQVIHDYRESLKTCSAGTQKYARLHLGWFAKFVGEHFKVQQLKAHHLTSYLRTKPHWKSGTTRCFITKLLAALNHSVREGYLSENPLKGYRRPMPEYRKDIITEEDQDALEAHCIGEFRVLLIGLRETGCRPAELAGARIEKWNRDVATLTVRNKTAKATGFSERTVYLSPRMTEVVTDLAGERKDGYIFRNAWGRKWGMSAMEQRFQRARDEVGIDKNIKMYSYRSRYITRCLERGIDPITVAELVGHVDIGMIKRAYARLSKDHLKRAVVEATRR